jgi:hypothetical protein
MADEENDCECQQIFHVTNQKWFTAGSFYYAPKPAGIKARKDPF